MKTPIKVILKFVQKVSFILMLLFFSSTINAQVKTDNKRVKKHQIYFSPLNIFYSESAAAQVTFGKILKNENELQVSYSHILTNWVPIKAEAGFFSRGFYPTMKSGFRLGLEYQTFLKTSKRTYFGYEAYYQSHTVDYHDFIYLNEEGSTRETEQRIGLNFKLGHKFDFKNGFTIDLYTGLGVGLNKYTYSNLQTQELRIAHHYIRPTLPINIKIGYNFKS